MFAYCYGKSDRNGCAFRLRAVYIKRAAVKVDYFVADRKTKTGAGLCGRTFVKPVFDKRKLFLFDAAAVIFKDYRISARAFKKVYFNLAVLRGVLDGVIENIYEDLLYSVRVALDYRLESGSIVYDFNACRSRLLRIDIKRIEKKGKEVDF